MSEGTVQPKPAVSAVIVRDGKILLVKRGREPNRGLWSLPGGSIEPGEAIDDAIVREVEEETRMRVTVGALAAIHEVIKRDGDKLQFHYIIISKYAQPISGELHPDSDAADARWVPLDEIQQYQTTPGLIDHLKSMELIR